jgi:hypothetical protein
MDEFWIKNPEILINKYYEILPTNGMTRVEQMNAVSRILIYILILVMIFDRKTEIIIFILVGLSLIIALYFIYMNDKQGINNDLINENKDEFEKFDSKQDLLDNQELNKNILNLYENKKEQNVKSLNSKLENKVVLESGYIDFDGNYKIGENNADISIYEQNKSKPKISMSKDKIIKEKHCRKPTVENPFNNVLFSDYLEGGNVPQPCNSNETTLSEMQNLYNSSIYRNLSDVFERENSQRTFYSVPIEQNAESQTDFANWLYKTGPTCHENSQYCTYYQDPSMVSQRY